MPTYEYKCEACGHEFEKFQQMSAGHIKKCPVCGKLKLKRLIGTGAGLIFKGSGFYITDYRTESYKKGEEGAAKPTETAKPADGAKTGGETKATTDTTAKPAETGKAAEAKPAAKSESKATAPAPAPESKSKSNKSKS
jgi:putative FmdB family regulatory protein